MRGARGARVPRVTARGWRGLLSAPYGWAVAARRRAGEAGSTSLGAPTVSIGNLHFGGAAKTPMAVWTARALADRGDRPAVLTRGYGGRLDRTRVLAGRDGSGPPWAAPVADLSTGEERPAHAWVDACGDEAPLLAARLAGVPVGVDPDRARAAEAVRGLVDPVSHFLLDDGLQNPSVARDVDIAMLPAVREATGLRLRPGALREGPAALSRCQAVVLVVDEADRVDPAWCFRLLNALDWRGPWALAERVPVSLRRWPGGDPVPVRALVGQRAVALTGLGDPASFAAVARAGLGVDLVRHQAHPDHHRFTPGDRAELPKWVRRWEADVALTSEKDALRLPPDWDPGIPLWVVGISLSLSRGDAAIRSVLP